MRMAQTSNTMFKGGSSNGLVAALASRERPPTVESIKRFAPKFARLVELVQKPPRGKASPQCVFQLSLEHLYATKRGSSCTASGFGNTQLTWPYT